MDEAAGTTQGRPDDGTTRREVLQRAGGMAGLSLLSLLGAGGLFARQAAAAAPDDPLAPRPQHFPARAKHCIFLFMQGGPSQMDLFDYKPGLQARAGQTIELDRRRHTPELGRLLGSQRSFRQYGQTGQWCSDAFPALSRHMDKLAVLKSLYTDSFAHGSAVLQLNSGQIIQGHPALGCWLLHGLGTGNRNLPGFVVMHDPRGGPISGTVNWASGYMPAAYQGTLFRSSGDPLLDLTPTPMAGRGAMTRAMQREQLDLIGRLNAHHAAARPASSDLAARAGSYELAYEMQVTAPEALDLSQEDEATRAMYCVDEPPGEHPLSVGPAPFGRQCLLARRLLQRGVRFVQIYQGGGHQQQTWDAHQGVEENLSIHCPEVDRPIAALLEDLQRTGLLDETLVIWGGEFGRMPVSQMAGAGQTECPDGRDHNPKAFTMWLAGAGVRPGSYGATDEIGAEAVEGRRHVRELHATILHLMGLDYRRLTYPYGGLDRRLTGPADVELIREVLA
ncbi:MAG: DUF1501 domain-containing protein [Planctomycetes bacterium]|nr:DUF1501 domain-containing protein [Planctomycetota bacterium]